MPGAKVETVTQKQAAVLGPVAGAAALTPKAAVTASPVMAPAGKLRAATQAGEAPAARVPMNSSYYLRATAGSLMSPLTPMDGPAFGRPRATHRTNLSCCTKMSFIPSRACAGLLMDAG